MANIKYKTDEKTGCWIWLGAIDCDGYGAMKKDSKRVRSHRYYYEKLKGRVPQGLELDHLCRNRRCVNPKHLEAVTRAVNAQRGLSTKLTPESVIEIRKRYQAGEKQHFLASLFFVGQDQISRIVNLQRWSNI